MTTVNIDENHPSYITAYVLFALLQMDLRELPESLRFEADCYTCEDVAKFVNEQRGYNHLPSVDTEIVRQILNHCHNLNLVQQALYHSTGETRYHFIRSRNKKVSDKDFWIGWNDGDTSDSIKEPALGLGTKIIHI